MEELELAPMVAPQAQEEAAQESAIKEPSEEAPAEEGEEGREAALGLRAAATSCGELAQIV